MREILSTIATANGWEFEYARRDYHNLYDELEAGQICLFLDPVAKTVNFGDYNEEVSSTQSGSFLILTASDVDDETYNTKYVDHIKPLLDDTLALLYSSIACDGEVQITSWSVSEVINLFDYNLDGILVNFSVDISTPSPAYVNPYADDFIFSIDTRSVTYGSSAENQFQLPLSSATTNITVYWGDGTSDVITSYNQAETLHTYPRGKEYTVRIVGSDYYFFVNNYAERLKFRNIYNWGLFIFKNASVFKGCYSLTVTATDVPTITSTSMSSAFYSCYSLDIPNLKDWDFSTVTSGAAVMFYNTSFNSDLTGLTFKGNLAYFLQNARMFNGDVSGMDVSSVNSFEGVFHSCSLFNQDVSGWDVSSGVYFTAMFYHAYTFNQDVSGWDVSNGTQFINMFGYAFSFNQDIGGWDVSNATNMSYMFQSAFSFNQDLGAWDIHNVSNFTNFMAGVTLSDENYDATLVGWEATLQSYYPNGVGYPHSININFGYSKYLYAGEAARDSLINNFGWTITDGGLSDAAKFIITVKTDNAGTSTSTQFTLPWVGTYDVEWGDGTSSVGVTDTQTHTYSTAGTYDVKVAAATGQIRFANLGDKDKLVYIKNWGDVEWTSMGAAFQGCSELTDVSAFDTPNFSSVTTMSAMFRDCTSLTTLDVSSWDVSSVGSMMNMFRDCTSLTSLDVSSWDVSSVGNVSVMFYGCSSLTALDVSSWNVGSITNMSFMFYNCSSLTTLDVSSWDVSSVTNMSYMFQNCTSLVGLDPQDWDINQVTIFTDFATGVTISTVNYDALLVKWEANLQATYPNGVGYTPTININFGNSQYSSAADAARTSLITNFGWTITDGGLI